ncbi:class I SAM-dependent methyltransferase [Embleya sp. NBC_00888]|uniref:class I SAM-dependent DNA methyltransferase n=1 Tax=Embleya sp. NBC_00888 TaxID=2975960 RepID=UPI003870572D|nr:class I SAM-dependent methyltransferase [Embleya sp. NBC_00888]
MFTEIASVYDLVKSHRDYAGEAATIRRLIHQHASTAKTLLDVACGTGSLLAFLTGYHRVGLDASTLMLDVARNKLGDEVGLHHGRMESFQLSQTVEVLLCLDGALGYVSARDLETTLTNFARHMTGGGLVVVEPWYTPEAWRPGLVHVVHHQDEATTVVRVGYGYPNGRIDFHNVVGTADGIRHFDERYDFTLHTDQALQTAFRKAGFTEVRQEAAPGFGRGLYLARRM